MRYIPHDYQTEAERWVLEHPSCALFLDCGLGKTVITLSAVDELLMTGQVTKVLVIAPLRVAQTVWAEEAQKWDHLRYLRCVKVLGEAPARIEALDRDADIYIINRDNVQWLVEYMRIRKKKWKWDMLVLDELSSFKSPKAFRFKSLQTVRGKWKRVVGLTGTPMPNSQLDLWSQIFLLDGGERLYPTYTKYRNTFFYEKGYTHEWKLRNGAAPAIMHRIDDICMSMKAKDYLSVPPVQMINRYAVMKPREEQVYMDMRKRSVIEVLVDSGVESTGETVTISALSAGVLAGKLRQLANGAIYDDTKQEHEVHTAKLEELDTLIEESMGHPIIVFYAYRHDLSRIRNRYPQARELVTPEDVKAWNRGDIPVLVAHPASMGHGLNLQQGGNIIVWFGLPWSLELYQQANARLHRQGQEQVVRIYHIITRGTVDERIMNVLEGKAAQQDELMEAVKLTIADVTREAKEEEEEQNA